MASPRQAIVSMHAGAQLFHVAENFMLKQPRKHSDFQSSMNVVSHVVWVTRLCSCPYVHAYVTTGSALIRPDCFTKEAAIDVNVIGEFSQTFS